MASPIDKPIPRPGLPPSANSLAMAAACCCALHALFIDNAEPRYTLEFFPVSSSGLARCLPNRCWPSRQCCARD